MPEDKHGELHLAATRFVRAVEAVFDSDWTYTKSMLGIAATADDPVDDEDPTSGPHGTFLKPTDDEAAVDNWGHYEILLDTYRQLKTLLVVPRLGAMNAHVWSSSLHGPISELAIRELHRPPESHRISPSVYAAGTRFQGAMRAGRVYVLAGCCTYTFKDARIRMGPGEFGDLVRGDFEFQVADDGPCSIVTVWNLGSLFDSGGDKQPR